MSTYIPNVTDYIPQVQPFVPDYNFYAGVLGASQSKYDQAHRQLGSLYGSLLNAPLTRDDNTANRDKFFKTIEQDIQKMSGMDLSLSQNVDAAKTVFNQLLDNKNIVYDMVWTKNFQAAASRSQGFKNCIDPDKCGGSWWEGGDRLLTYQRENFRRATADQAMNIGMANFVPYQNVMKKAMKLAKEADLNVSMDQITGQWITTTKNGPLIVKPLQELFSGVIANDPKTIEYYTAKAEVGRQDFMYSNESQYGSLEAAEQAYINQMAPVVEKAFAGYDTKMEDAVNTNKAKIKKIDKAIENSTPEHYPSLDDLKKKYQNLGSAYEATLNEANEVTNNINNAKLNQKYSGYQLDRVMASLFLNEDIGKAAQVMSLRGAESSIKVNPYAMEAVQMKNRMIFEEYRTQNEMKLAVFKEQLKEDSETKQKKDAFGGIDGNVPNTVNNIPGNTAITPGEKTSDTFLNRGINQYAKDRDNIRTPLSNSERYIIGKTLTTMKAAADAGDVQAKEDYITLLTNIAATEDIASDNITMDDSVGDPTKTQRGNLISTIKRKVDAAKTTDEKYNIVKNLNLNTGIIPGYRTDVIYNNFMKDIQDPTNVANKTLRNYLIPALSTEEVTWHRRNIEAKDGILANMDNGYVSDIKEVIAQVRSSNKYGPEWGDAMESYFNEKGHIVDNKTFVKKMVSKGYSAEVANDMYRDDREKKPGIVDYGKSYVGGLLGTVSFGIPSALGANMYNTPTKIANGGEPGDVGDESGKGNHGIHDMWKRAFTEFATPNGDVGWLGMTGAGDVAARAQNYPMVDPAAYRSIGTMGLVSYLKDAIVSNNNAIFSNGYFSQSLPGQDLKVKQIAETVLRDAIYDKKGGDRVIPNITYSDIAGGNPNIVALNIKLNDNYRQKYKGTEKDPGLMADPSLSTEGFTMYMDRRNTNNLFTQGATKTSSEVVLGWHGKMNFDIFPDYNKEFAVTANKATGVYNVTGQYKAGLDGNGKPIWKAYDMAYPGGTDVNNIVQETEAKMRGIAEQNMQIEKLWVLQNKK